MNDPAWRRIADDIRTKIVSGECPPGSRIETLPELQARYSVGQKTVQTALAALEYGGYIEYRHGIGYFVTTSPPDIDAASSG